MKTSPSLLRSFVSPKLIATILVSLAAVPAPSRAEKGGSPRRQPLASGDARHNETLRSRCAYRLPRDERPRPKHNNRTGLQATPKTWSQSRTTLLPSQGSQRVAPRAAAIPCLRPSLSRRHPRRRPLPERRGQL